MYARQAFVSAAAEFSSAPTAAAQLALATNETRSIKTNGL